MLSPYIRQPLSTTVLLATPTHLCKGRRARVSVQLLASGLDGTVGQREFEVLGEELLDVGAADAVGLGDLDDLDDLPGSA